MSSFVFRPGLIGLTSLGLALAAGSAQAQDMRYLSWTGKPQTTPQTTSQPAPSTGRAQPSQAVRYPSMASMGRPSRYSPSVASGGLTPADAWFNPTQPRPQAVAPHAPYGASAPYAPQVHPAQAQTFQAAPSSQGLPTPAYALAAQTSPALPHPAYATGSAAAMSAAVPTTSPSPYPSAYPRGAGPQTAPQNSAYALPPAAWTQPGYAPQVYSGPVPPQTSLAQTSQPQASSAQTSSPVVSGPAWASPHPAMTGSTVADPMAPRRDAPIFSIQAARPDGQPSSPVQSAMSSPPVPAQTSPTVSASPPREGARYYSVHRQAGRQPDPAEIPESVYAVIPEGAFLDAARPDLADPPPAPMATRNINGRIQQINRGDDPSLP